MGLITALPAWVKIRLVAFGCGLRAAAADRALRCEWRWKPAGISCRLPVTDTLRRIKSENALLQYSWIRFMGIFLFLLFFYFSNKQKQAIDSATLPLAELSAEIVFQQVTLILTGCTKSTGPSDVPWLVGGRGFIWSAVIQIRPIEFQTTIRRLNCSLNRLVLQMFFFCFRFPVMVAVFLWTLRSKFGIKRL